MIIEFKTTKIKDICTKHKKAVKILGDRTAKKLHQRLTQLSAFESLQDIPVSKPFRRHKLIGDRNDCFTVNIDNQYRLIFVPINGDGEDLSSVTIISIEEVSKHYE